MVVTIATTIRELVLVALVVMPTIRETQNRVVLVVLIILVVLVVPIVLVVVMVLVVLVVLV